MLRALLITAVAAFSLSAAAPAVAQQTDEEATWGGEPVPDVMPRHRIVVREGLPSTFRDVRAPDLPLDAVERGQSLYMQHCAGCHGEDGSGTQPGVVGTDQYPGNLRRLVDTAFGESDGYMYWTIRRGGEPVGSNMPAFRHLLSDEELWSVVAYMREAFDD